MEPKVHLLVTALFVALMWSELGITTGLVTKQREPLNRLVRDPVAARKEDVELHVQIHAATTSSNFTGCGDHATNISGLLNNFRPCIPAVSVISEPPSKDCCTQVHAYGITCLCSMFTNYRSTIPSRLVSEDKIVGLPTECNLHVPEGSVCDGISIPTKKSTEDLDSAGKPKTSNFRWFTFTP
ncbi:unnamed protein product [Calypogeia fissa]